MTISRLVFIFTCFICLYFVTVQTATFEEESEAAEIALEDAIIESVKLDFRVRRNDELFITIVTEDSHKLCDGRITGVASLDQISCTFDPELFERPEIFIMTTVYSMTRKEIVSQTSSRFKNPSYGMLSQSFKRRLFIRRISQKVVRTAKDKRVWVTALLATGGYGIFVFFYPTSKSTTSKPVVNNLAITNFFTKPPSPPPSRRGFFLFPSLYGKTGGTLVNTNHYKSSSPIVRSTTASKTVAKKPLVVVAQKPKPAVVVAKKPVEKKTSPVVAKKPAVIVHKPLVVHKHPSSKTSQSSWTSFLSFTGKSVKKVSKPLLDLSGVSNVVGKGVQTTFQAVNFVSGAVGNATSYSFRSIESVAKQGVNGIVRVGSNVSKFVTKDIPKHLQLMVMVEDLVFPFILGCSMVLLAMLGRSNSQSLTSSSSKGFWSQKILRSSAATPSKKMFVLPAAQNDQKHGSSHIRVATTSTTTSSAAKKTKSIKKENPIALWMKATKKSAVDKREQFQQLPLKSKRRWYLSIFTLVAQGVYFAMRKKLDPRFSPNAIRSNGLDGHEYLVPFRN